MSTQHKSWSFIELIIVMAMISLLIAFALPRLINIIQQAKQAAIVTISGNFSTAVLSARMQWETDGRPQMAKDNNIVNYDGSVFKLTPMTAKQSALIGYPFALLTSKTANVSQITAQDCVDLISHLLQPAPLATAISADAAMGKYAFFATVERQYGEQRCRYYQLATVSNYRFDAINVIAGHSFTYIPTQGRVEVNLHQTKD